MGMAAGRFVSDVKKARGQEHRLMPGMRYACKGGFCLVALKREGGVNRAYPGIYHNWQESDMHVRRAESGGRWRSLAF